MKKLLSGFLMILITALVFTACGNAPQSGGASETANTSAPEAQSEAPVAPSETDKPAEPVSTFDTTKSITVVSREDGSGTRGAFIELLGVEVKNNDGTKKDMTTDEADIVNKTDVMLTSIAGNPYAIGYISLGSLNDTVKAVLIEGVEASTENVKNGTYTVSRPFNIATKGEPTGLAKDFIDFILSSEGQAVVAQSYIAVNDGASAYEGDKPSGKLVIAGSSSVTPIMEKLKEAYAAINPNATIEIQMSDSTAGMTGAIDGTCDIGMSSRALKDSEKETLQGLEIALDGIAVIINNENTIADLTKDQVKSIFTGEAANWSQLAE